LKRFAGALAVAALIPAPAAAHEPQSGKPVGYAASVTAIQPNVLGLRARTVLGDQLLVSNLSRTPIVILDASGGPLIRIPTGRSRAWHDARIVETGPPPEPPPGVDPDAPRFVKAWRVPGRAGGRAFAINGVLGWVPPDESAEGSPVALLAGGTIFLLALTAGGAYLLLRSRA
jgi:hypothetical protein